VRWSRGLHIRAERAAGPTFNQTDEMDGDRARGADALNAESRVLKGDQSGAAYAMTTSARSRHSAHPLIHSTILGSTEAS